MSAIFGVYNLDGKAVASQLLERMSGVLAHRGSDDAGVWNDGAVGLGHRMLWTTPESLHEKLPLKSNESAVVVTCDVRLDNRDELIAELSLSSKPADEIADGEIILKAYERWGEDCPAKLIGDFAFVVWDERRRQLFCARDHFGVKPFNYFASEKCFAFASEAKALFQIEAVSRGLDEGMIADYFIGNFENKTKTFYQKILRLPPAHSLTIRVDGEPRLQCYYRLDPHLEAPMRSNDEYAEGLREIFNEAVRCRMRRTKSLGTKLSGGLDSSSIACVARDLLREQGGDDSLPTFSLVYDRNKKCDEREYINCVLSQGGFEPHFISGEEQTSPLSNLKTICWHADRPAIAPGGSSAWKLYKNISDAGVRVVFDGHDGDSAVSHGYKYLDELAQSGRWVTLAIEAGELAPVLSMSRWKIFKSYVNRYRWRPFLDKYPTLKKVRYVKRVFPKRGKSKQSWTKIQLDARSAIVNKDFAKRVNLTDRQRAANVRNSLIGAKNAREYHYRQITNGLQVFALEEFDAISSAFGVDSRFPFWDKRLIEYCLSLPGDQKYHRGWNRVVMRRAMNDTLPPEVCWRKTKTDFTENFIDGMVHQEQERLENLLTADNNIHEFFDQNAMREMYQKFNSRALRSDDLETRSNLRLCWEIASFSSWFNHAHL